MRAGLAVRISLGYLAIVGAVVPATLQVLRPAGVAADRMPEELAAIEAELGRGEDLVRRLIPHARPLEPCAR